MFVHPGRALCAVVAGVVVVSLSGCAGGGSGSGVASLSAKSAASKGDSKKQPSQQDTEAAFRQFAQCMREHGIDMQDPTVNGRQGNIILGSPGAPIDKTKVDAAQQACQHFIDSVVQGRKRDVDPAEEAKMRDRALKFSKCMRDHGIDMPDPEFQSGGRVSQHFGSGANPNDPKFQNAQNACAKDLPKGPKGGKGADTSQVGPGGGGGQGLSVNGGN
jgi:hypothetical protein